MLLCKLAYPNTGMPRQTWHAQAVVCAIRMVTVQIGLLALKCRVKVTRLQFGVTGLGTFSRLVLSGFVWFFMDPFKCCSGYFS